MQPAQLKPEYFAAYPPLARKVATDGIDLLRHLPLSFVPLLLREVVAYDWKFPAERSEVDAQFSYLGKLSPEQLRSTMQRFAQLQLSPQMENVDWVNSPEEFSEQLSAHLWTTNQLALFRTAAVELLSAVRNAVPPPAPAASRLVIVVLGQGVKQNTYRLFRKLRPQGTLFTRVNPENGLNVLLGGVAARAAKHPAPFAHWYIDGGSPAKASAPGVELIAYGSLEPLRTAVVTRMRSLVQARQGTEARRSALARLRPQDVGLKATGQDGVSNHFKLAMLSEGSGTQFFSTSFVQWTAREALRRAQPLTLLARFAPRMTELSMNEALAGSTKTPVLDPQGALVDADMAAYYTWLNLRRLTGADQSSFLIWFEGHQGALAISPALSRGAQSNAEISVQELLGKVTS
ncbi:MAG: hypothetical protein AB7O65_04485 [Candidatus Korobacteraceae bacterium]